MTTALTTYDSMKTDLLARHDHLTAILPPQLVASGTLTAERFTHLGLLHFAESHGLDQCTKQSLLTAIYHAAKDGMEPGIDCYILPFRDRKKGIVEATYVRDYRGDVKLIERTGKVAKAFAEVVYEHDVCEIDYGNHTKPITHKPALRQRGKPLGAYGAIVLTTGAWHVHYMDAEDLKRVKQQAPGRSQDTWITHETEMWRKTALKNTAKYCQLTPQVQDAFHEEDTTIERVWTPDPEQARHNIAAMFDHSSGDPRDDVGDRVRQEARAVAPQQEALAAKRESALAPYRNWLKTWRQRTTAGQRETVARSTFGESWGVIASAPVERLVGGHAQLEVWGAYLERAHQDEGHDLPDDPEAFLSAFEAWCAGETWDEEGQQEQDAGEAGGPSEEEPGAGEEEEIHGQ